MTDPARRQGTRSRLLALAAAAAMIAAGAVSSAGAQSTAPDNRPHLLVVPDTPEGQAALADSAARVIAEYQSFSLVESRGRDTERLRAAGADVRDDMRRVETADGAVDPSSRREQLDGKGDAAPKRPGLALVQFAGPVKDAWLERLRRTGVRPLTYVPQNAYLVHGSAGALAEAANLNGTDPAVRAVTPYAREDKLDVGGKAVPAGARAWAVQTVAGSAGSTARGRVAAAGRAVRGTSSVGELRTQFVELTGAEATSLAADPAVVSVEPWVAPKLYDERAAQIVAGNLNGSFQPTGAGYLAFLDSENLDTLSPATVIDVTDEGIDNGGVDSGPTTPAHEDFVGKIEYARNWTADSDAKDCGGHGSNVASIATGANNESGTAYADSPDSFNFGLGVAPGARLGSSKIFRCTSGAFSLVGGTLTDLAANAYAKDARISNNSWGADVGGAYTVDSQEYDAIVRDARPADPGNQEFVQVFANGNDGPGEESVGSPGSAKNVISVGASENVRPGTSFSGCTVTAARSDSARDVIDFSARGPTSDGRIKPDVVAPGTHVTGAQPQVGSSYNGSGTSCPRFPSGSTLYSLVSGTSQATPEVSGLAALIREWFPGPDPSPAMTKALMVNSAQDLEGGSDGAGGTIGPAPNGDQGWGRVHLKNILDGPTRQFVDQDPAEELTASGQAFEQFYNVATPGQPLKVTLAWTDPPGPVTGDSFVNDLDLVVEGQGETWKGNVLAGGESARGGAADTRNNVESVFLPGDAGAFKVRVVGTSIGGDGVPGDTDTTDQDFALVVTNANVDADGAPVLVHDRTRVDDSTGTGTDNDGVAEPGETFKLVERLRNVGDAASTASTSATLTETPDDVLTLDDAASEFGAIAPGARAENDNALNPYTVTLPSGAANCGRNLDLRLAVTTTEGTTNVPLSVETGRAGAHVFTADGNPPQPIPDDNATGITNTVNVAGGGLIKDVDIRIDDLTHTFVGDLQLEVTHGSTTVELADGPGGFNNGDDNLTGTIFDDEAERVIGATGTAAPYTGRVRPQFGQLSAFDGQSQSGAWTLRVRDLGASDTGTLNTWGPSLSVATCSTGDTAAPEVTLDSPRDGTGTADVTPELSGRAGVAPADATTVRVKIFSGEDTSGTEVENDTTTVTDGDWTFTPSPGLAEGTYTAQAEQQDASNTGKSEPVTFRVDQTDPTLTLSPPGNEDPDDPGTRYTDATPAFDGVPGTAPGDRRNVTVKVYSGPNTSGTLVKTFNRPIGTSGGDNSWEAELGEPVGPDGEYTAQAEQQDDAGNEGQSTARTFMVDSVAPSVTLDTGPAAESTDNTPAFSGTYSEGATDEEEVRIRVYRGTTASGAVARTVTLTGLSGGTWNTTLAALGDGTYTAQAEQDDLVPNTDKSSQTFTFRIDTTGPGVTIDSPASGSTSQARTPVMTGRAGTSSGDQVPVTLDVYAGGTIAGLPVRRMTVNRSGGGWSATVSPELPDGVYTAVATQSDSLGNGGSSSPINFVVDNVAPDTGITAGPQGTVKDRRAVFGFSASEAAAFECRVDGGPFAPCASSQAFDGFQNGGHSVEVRAIDAAGNVDASPASRGWTVNAGAPRIQMALSRTSLTSAIARGLKFRVSCSQTCNGRIELVLDGRTSRKLKLTRRRRATVVGKAAVSLQANRTSQVIVKFSRKLRRRLRPVDSLRVTARLRVTDTVGNAGAADIKKSLRR